MKKLQKSSLLQYIEFFKTSKIICFGLGIQGKRALMFLDSWGCSENVKCVLDNNSRFSGSTVQCGDCTIPIRQPSCLPELWEKNSVILIASLYYREIFEQLEKMDEKGEYVAVALDEISDIELEYDDYSIIHESTEPLIPKVIHYAWFGGEKTTQIERNIEEWKRLCPDYKFVEWNESNYDVSKNRYMNQAYTLGAWGFVPDYLRLDVLYQYGGIYLDTDIQLLKRPDDLLYQRCFASVDASLTMNLGSGFGCVAGCEIIKELRDYYDSCTFVDEEGIIDKTSCNTHSYRVLRTKGYQIDNRLQTVCGMNIYPISFQGKNQHTGKTHVSDNTYWIHHGNMSWF